MVLGEKKEPTPTHYNFNQIPGPSSNIDRNSTPAQLFCRFFTDEVWDLLVEETTGMLMATPLMLVLGMTQLFRR